MLQTQHVSYRQPKLGHLRTWGGKREIDFVVSEGGKKTVALEVKLTQEVADFDVRHLHWLAGELSNELADAAILTTGTEAYRRPDGIAVIPLALLGP